MSLFYGYKSTIEGVTIEVTRLWSFQAEESIRFECEFSHKNNEDAKKCEYDRIWFKPANWTGRHKTFGKHEINSLPLASGQKSICVPDGLIETYVKCLKAEGYRLHHVAFERGYLQKGRNIAEIYAGNFGTGVKISFSNRFDGDARFQTPSNNYHKLAYFVKD